MFTWQASPTASGQFCLSKRDFTCWRKAHKARVGFRAGHPTGIRRATHGEVSTPDANSGKLTRAPARTKASQPCILRGWHTPIKQPSRSWLSQKIAHSVVSVYLRAPVRWPESLTAYRCQLREKRLQEYREEIRQVAQLLQAEKVALTQRHIARYLEQPAILRDPKVRNLLREVCREVETKNGVTFP